MERQHRSHPRAHPDITRLTRAVKRAAPLRARVVDAAHPRPAQVRAPPVHERQDRPIIEQHPPVPRATRPPARPARQRYHNDRTNPTAFVGERRVESRCVMGSGLIRNSRLGVSRTERTTPSARDNPRRESRMLIQIRGERTQTTNPRPATEREFQTLSPSPPSRRGASRTCPPVLCTSRARSADRAPRQRAIGRCP